MSPRLNAKFNPFKWRHYEASIILLCMRWYCTYPLSYRQVAEMVNERGIEVNHTTIFRWVQHYAPKLERRCRPYLRPTNDSWRVDETYIKIKGKQKYLYRAVDSEGNALDFLLTAKRDAQAAKRFLRKALNAVHAQESRVIIAVLDQMRYILKVERFRYEVLVYLTSIGSATVEVMR